MSDRGIDFQPDSGDPKRVTLTSGLPEGVSRAEISYRTVGGLRGSRSGAEFARLYTVGGGCNATEQLTLDHAERYIEQARARIREQDNEIRRIRASVDLRCPWCARERTYLGVLGFMTGVAGIRTDRPAEWGQELIHQHAYRCDRCGSMQYFADGYLAHPLPTGPESDQDRPRT